MTIVIKGAEQTQGAETESQRVSLGPRHKVLKKRDFFKPNT